MLMFTLNLNDMNKQLPNIDKCKRFQSLRKSVHRLFNISLFTPCLLTLQVVPFDLKLWFFSKIPRGGRWVYLVDIKAWPKRRRFEKILDRKQLKIDHWKGIKTIMFTNTP